MNESELLEFPQKEYETLRVLLVQVLSVKCECISCVGLRVLAKRIVKHNSTSEADG